MKIAPTLEAWVKSGEAKYGKQCNPLPRAELTALRGLRVPLEEIESYCAGLMAGGLGMNGDEILTFASQWVMAGRSIVELQHILGHYSVIVTERYAHLRPDLFSEGAHDALRVDLTPGGAPVTKIEPKDAAGGKP